MASTSLQVDTSVENTVTMNLSKGGSASASGILRTALQQFFSRRLADTSFLSTQIFSSSSIDFRLGSARTPLPNQRSFLLQWTSTVHHLLLTLPNSALFRVFTFLHHSGSSDGRSGVITIDDRFPLLYLVVTKDLLHIQFPGEISQFLRPFDRFSKSSMFISLSHSPNRDTATMIFSCNARVGRCMGRIRTLSGCRVGPFPRTSHVSLPTIL